MRGLAGNTVGHGKVRKKLNFYLFGLFERGNGVVKRKTPEIIAEGAGKLRTLKFATKKRQKAVKTQRFNAIKRQLDQKPRKSNFSKQFPPAAAEGSALWTPGRGAAPAPRACAASGRALPLHPAPARRAAGLCPAPAGAFAPDPEMLTHLCFACGRDGGLGAATSLPLNDQSARTAADWSGRCFDGCFPIYCSDARKVAGIMTPATFLSFRSVSWRSPNCAAGRAGLYNGGLFGIRADMLCIHCLAVKRAAGVVLTASTAFFVLV